MFSCNLKKTDDALCQKPKNSLHTEYKPATKFWSNIARCPTLNVEPAQLGQLTAVETVVYFMVYCGKAVREYVYCIMQYRIWGCTFRFCIFNFKKEYSDLASQPR
jgi:prolipoprotein diacylglyceryltransferase